MQCPELVCLFVCLCLLYHLPERWNLRKPFCVVGSCDDQHDHGADDDADDVG